MNINHLLQLADEQINNTKIHFATGSKSLNEALLAFYQNDFKEWQESQSKKNFERDYILALIYYRPDEWLYGGFYKRLGVAPFRDNSTSSDRFKYETELLPIGKELIGKLVVQYKKGYRASYTYCEKYIQDIVVLELLREKSHIMPFPGYENIKIDFDLLQSIILQEEPSWKTALSNVKGVYLIADKLTGKLYVGSAYGEDSFWSRWKNYTDNGHGHNEGLKEVISTNNVEYASNFQFSILEISTVTTDKDIIIQRESFWKDILLSRQFGYNRN